LPAPGAGTVAASRYAFFVDLRDDFAVSGQQGLGRAHLGAERQFSLSKPVRAILLILRLAAVRLRSAGAIGALVHFAARAEIPNLRVLRGAERAGVEAVAATDAQVLAVQHDGVRRGVKAIDRANRSTWCVGAVHAGHRDRPFARLAVIERD